KNKEGVIDWQNPQKLQKLPTLANMNDLDFYPPNYERTLNELKMKTDKKFRDSVYLSLEEFGRNINESPNEETVTNEKKTDTTQKDFVRSKNYTIKYFQTFGDEDNVFKLKIKSLDDDIFEFLF